MLCSTLNACFLILGPTCNLDRIDKEIFDSAILTEYIVNLCYIHTSHLIPGKAIILRSIRKPGHRRLGVQLYCGQSFTQRIRSHVLTTSSEICGDEAYGSSLQPLQDVFETSFFVLLLSGLLLPTQLRFLPMTQLFGDEEKVVQSECVTIPKLQSTKCYESGQFMPLRENTIESCVVFIGSRNGVKTFDVATFTNARKPFEFSFWTNFLVSCLESY